MVNKEHYNGVEQKPCFCFSRNSMSRPYAETCQLTRLKRVRPTFE